MKKLRSKNVDMLSGSITKAMIAMTMPILIMNVMQNLFGVIDMTILGRLVNDTATGAVGACGTLITLCTVLLIGVSIGANVIVARRIGAGDRVSTGRAVGTAMLFAVVGGIVLLIAGVLFAEAMLRLTNCPEALLPQAVIYFKLYFLGVPAAMIYNFSASILRAIGETKRPMYYLLLGGVVKVLLNLFAITVLHWTVEGVAVATLVSNVITGGLAFALVYKNREVLGFDLKLIRFHRSELSEILFVGIPTGVQKVLYSFANVVIVAAVNSFGENATTGVAIANQFDGILYQIVCATSFAATPYISQNIGAGKLSRAKKAVLISTLITIGFGAVFGTLSAVFSGGLSSLMSNTPEVIMYSCQKMVIVSSTYFICGINEIIGGALRGMGKPIVPTVSTLLFMCLIRFVWVYLVFPLYPNLTFLYLIWPIGWVLSIVTQLAFFFPTMSRLEKKALAHSEVN